MKPPPFEYMAATTVSEVVEALSGEDARVLAGGQSLIPMLNLRLARPSLLVDCNLVEEMQRVAVSDGVVRVGAACRQRRLELDPDLARVLPLLAEAAALVGHPQIRNRATLGGSLAHADPASELSAACMVISATVNVRSSRGERVVPVADLFDGFFMTVLQPDEAIVSVDIPAARRGWGYAFREYAPRQGDFALAGVAAAVERVGDAVGEIRLAGCGIGSTVKDLTSATQDLSGHPLEDRRLRAVAEEVAGAVTAGDDVHASAAYRRELVQVLTVEALRAAWRASGEAAA